jgi:hypothetical protein
MIEKHKWKLNDDLAAFYLYKYGTSSEIKSAAKKLNIKFDSLKMRIQNFAFLDTNKGLRNYSKQTESVYLSKKNLNKIELKAEYELAIS